jgi:hypothetical protein
MASRTVKDSGMTDKQWEAQNSRLGPSAAEKRGLCWACGGKRVLYTAFGGVQRIVDCTECRGTGKAR